MRLQRKISKSIRIPRHLRSLVGREIVRLSLNPVLYTRSSHIVRWNRNGNSRITAQEVVLQALKLYPGLSLSAAVEAVLVDLLEQEASRRTELKLSENELADLKRFAPLPLHQKIRLTQRRLRLYRYLSNLPWKRDESRKGI